MEPQEIEKEARAMGWLPKEEFKGPDEHFVPADEYLEKGKTLLPLLNATNSRLKGQLNTLTGTVSSLEATVKAQNAAMAAMEEARQADVAEQVEEARKNLKAELVAASREGNHLEVAEITDKLTQLNAEARDAEAAAEAEAERKKAAANNTTQRTDPEVAAWYGENADFVNNPRKMALAQGVAYELRQAGEKAIGRAFMDKVAAEVETVLGGPRRVSKVEGGGGGSNRSDVRTGATKTYADLPAEAKAACDKMAARLVGPNRAHKDVKSWQASYTEQYFRE